MKSVIEWRCSICFVIILTLNSSRTTWYQRYLIPLSYRRIFHRKFSGISGVWISQEEWEITTTVSPSESVTESMVLHFPFVLSLCPYSWEHGEGKFHWNHFNWSNELIWKYFHHLCMFELFPNVFVLLYGTHLHRQPCGFQQVKHILIPILEEITKSFCRDVPWVKCTHTK